MTAFRTEQHYLDFCKRLIRTKKMEDKPEMKYCWLNTATGEFSNSWDQKMQDDHGASIMEDSNDEDENKQWKLIGFVCLTHPEFEFMNKMKLR